MTLENNEGSNAEACHFAAAPEYAILSIMDTMIHPGARVSTLLPYLHENKFSVRDSLVCTTVVRQ